VKKLDKSILNKRIFVAGHNGMVGSSLLKNLQLLGFKKIYTENRFNLDLINQEQVKNYLEKNKFDHIYICAAKVGGIVANSKYPVDFLYNNLMFTINLLHYAFISRVEKVLYLGSSCIYPKKNKIPIKENSLLTGPMETTNLPYALSKISGLVLCKSYNIQYPDKTIFKSLMPTNLYGPNDHYDPVRGHVIPSLIYKIHNAKIKKKKVVMLLGTGKAKRDFLFVDDLAKFSIKYLLNFHKKKYKNFDYINVGSGKEISIKNLANYIKNIIGYKGKIIFDNTSPDGHMSKLLNNKISEKFGFKQETELNKGIKIAYLDFLKKNNEKK
jgi:GDP-L-fucose synthase